jgi:ATP-dependent Lhr-like helicase
LETLGAARRGYFVEGLGGAQFALPGAVERLRAQGDDSPVVLAAVDPAQPYGSALPWPSREGASEGRRPARVPGAYVVLAGGEPIVYLERSGRALQTLVDTDDPRVEAALSALVDQVRAGRIKRLALERVDGEPALGSTIGALLTTLGFQEGPRRLTLSA